MNYITVEAKTLDEAISKAMMELGTSSDNIEYEITEKGSSGFLGLFGGKNVVIRAKKKKDDDLDELYAAVVEGREVVKKEDKKEAAKEPEKAPVKEQPKKVSEQQPKAEVKEPKKEARKDRDDYKEFKTEFRTESKYEVKSLKGKELPKANKNTEKKGPRNIMKEPKPQPQQQAPSREKTKPARNSYREEEIRAEREREERERLEKERREKENRKPINVEACENAARSFLSQVLGAMNMNVNIDIDYNEEEREMTVNLSGDDMGILIGKRGQTLDSLQYLSSLVVNRQTEGYLRVKLDTENYRSRRKATLEELAKNIAFKVKRTRKSVSLEPMNPYERRIIHSTLQNNKYVVTRSEGEDPYRHVVVSLKRDYGRNRKSRYGGRSTGMNPDMAAAETNQPAAEEITES